MPLYLDTFHASSIIFEVIKTISSLFIFLFKERFRVKRKHPNNFPPSYKFLCANNCCFCCLVFAYFCLISWFLLDLRFLCVQNLTLKKINKLEIFSITSKAILLMCTTLNSSKDNYFSPNLSPFYRIYLISSARTYFYL